MKSSVCQRNQQKAQPSIERRHMMYTPSKLVHRFQLGTIPTKK